MTDQKPRPSSILRGTALKQYIRRVTLRASSSRFKNSIPTINLTSPSTTTFIDEYEPDLLDKIELLTPSTNDTSLKATLAKKDMLSLSDLEVVRVGDCFVIRERKVERLDSCHGS
jgi:hypothetical protein